LYGKYAGQTRISPFDGMGDIILTTLTTTEFG